MRNPVLRLTLIGCFVTVLAARSASAEVCVLVDVANDTFSPPERDAALLILGRQFELAGERVVPVPCPDQYSLSHIQLGDTISVTLIGPRGRRDATAIGLNDIPAVYNQMVRSVLTGQPMRAVIDRTNVSENDTGKLRVGSDSVFYSRLGYGAIFGKSTRGVPSIGLIGYRHELDSFGIDISFMNFQFGNSAGNGGGYGGGPSSHSLVKLEGLYFKTPQADRSAYFGGGLSWTGASVSDSTGYWSGSGLQGELTAGYEIARSSTVRLFVQADAGLPFYRLVSTLYEPYEARPYPGEPYARPTFVTRHQYAPSLAISMGLGWQRQPRGRR